VDVFTVARAAHPKRVKRIDEVMIPLQIGRHMADSKDTPKAIAIIVIALATLAGLLVFANHIRPHP
jgi:ABC-type spermidine/putrescine transport system permease subunit I